MGKYSRILVSLLLAFSLSLLATSARAIEDKSTSPSAEPAGPVSSYELFWPMVAGKTEGDSLYFLKTLKEDIRGVFIFGDAQKAEYAVFLATKRVLEAEVLMAAGKTDLAVKTLDKAQSQFKNAGTGIEKVKSKGSSMGGSKDEITNKLNNMQKLIPQLISGSDGGFKARLEEIGKQTQDLLTNLL